VDPDAYVDIVDTVDPMPIILKFSFQNSEGLTLYVKVELLSAPEGYSMEPVEAGSVDDGSIIDFTAVLNRSKPSGADFMEIEEVVTLRVSTYTDSGYTALYEYIDVDITVHIINSDHASWNKVLEVDFDDGSLDGLTSVKEIISGCLDSFSAHIFDDVYFSPPYSAGIDVYLYNCIGNANVGYKFVVDVSSYSKAFLVFYARVSSNVYKGIHVVFTTPSGEKAYYADVDTVDKWFKVVVPIPLDASEVKVMAYINTSTIGHFYFYLDSIKVVAV